MATAGNLLRGTSSQNSPEASNFLQRSSEMGAAILTIEAIDRTILQAATRLQATRFPQALILMSAAGASRRMFELSRKSPGASFETQTFFRSSG
ncbi:hypothetical protein [Bosea thiooxidans]